ncbi:MAG: hypothetical protein K1X64_20505 [Myxococcaceae bacterium]|nr:hypothetical protein [Myxococcaceae bacterium]
MKRPSQGFWLVVVGACGTLALSQCSSAAPCGMCPNVEGRYTLVYEQGTLSAGCMGAYQPAPEIALSRTGAALTANYGSAALKGTLYDTYDMTLTGQEELGAGNPVTTLFRARYIEPLPGSDAGATLDGRVSRDQTMPDGGVCSVEHKLTGHKAP